ncbi:MAG: alkaline phosphatase D family protein [Pseudomonadota bacterium]
MTDLTRRGALGLFGGAAGLAGCATPALTDDVAAYAGDVAFEHGVASGDPLSDRVVIWTRVTPLSGDGPITVRYLMVDEGDDAQQFTGEFVTSAARDFTVKVDVDGLSDGRSYRYVFSVDTEAGEVRSSEGRTRTAAASGTTPVRAAVISCSNFPFGYFNVYEEISKLTDLDLVIHLGDYIYEYGNDGYGAEVGEALGRPHDPPHEILSLDDYRRRHAQYKADASLQKAHAAAPWLCTWDDHESTNNSYRTGAQNHNEGEGLWTDRKQRAVQVYLEWMPVRDPAPGVPRAAIWRSFDFGDVATITCLESRLTGRSEEISWGAELADVDPSDIPETAAEVLGRVSDPSRTMLGAEQETWLDERFSASAEAGKPWHVLANQVIMAEVRLPNLAASLTPEQIGGAVAAAGENGSFVELMVGFSALGLPSNLDAWDGFPAARERLYASAAKAGVELITLTGDTHTAWANPLKDKSGNDRGAEFGCTSVTSPGIGQFLPTVDDLGQMYADANDQVYWFDPHGHGFVLVTFRDDRVDAEFRKVSTVAAPDYEAHTEAVFTYTKDVGLQQV